MLSQVISNSALAFSLPACAETKLQPDLKGYDLSGFFSEHEFYPLHACGSPNSLVCPGPFQSPYSTKYSFPVFLQGFHYVYCSLYLLSFSPSGRYLFIYFLVVLRNLSLSLSILKEFPVRQSKVKLAVSILQADHNKHSLFSHKACSAPSRTKNSH